MEVSNIAYVETEGFEAKKGREYLVVTGTKALFVVRQTGERSWGAFPMDFGNDKIISGNRGTIMAKAYNELNVDYVVRVNDKLQQRKLIMGHLFGGDMFKDFNIERITYD